MSVRDGLSRGSETVPADRVAIRFMALVEERSDLEEEVLGRNELVREQVKDGFSMSFRDDDSAVPKERLRLALWCRSARKKAQIVFTDKS